MLSRSFPCVRLRTTVGSESSNFSGWKALSLLLAVSFYAGCSKSPSTVPEVRPAAAPKRIYLGESSRGETGREGTRTGAFERWVDGTSSSGLRFQYQNGVEGGQFSILESVGGGVAVLDFDRDGDLDVFFPGGGAITGSSPVTITGRACGLFRNDGRGEFQDISSLVQLAEPLPYSHGAFVADFNRDGYPDILMTGYRGCRLLRNDAGERLTDVTKSAGLSLSQWTTAAAWGDVNRDGWADFAIVGYVEWAGEVDASCGDVGRGVRDVCPPQRYPASRQRLFVNNRDGTFHEIDKAFEGQAVGKGLGIVSLDLNEDNWIDFYVANDQVENQLYLGGPQFPLREVAMASGVAGSEFGVAEGSMGVDAGDYDGDGRPDLFVTNYELEDNSLYQNLGQGLFSHATVRSGLGGAGRPFVGFGTGFADFDLDGWLDLFVINGHVLYETGRSAYLQPSLLFRNEGSGNNRRFRDVSGEEGGPWFRERHAGRGAATADLDNDGDLDLVVTQQNAPAGVLFNQTQPAQWLSLQVRGTVSDPDAIGASVHYDFDGRKLVRHLRSGAGYLSQSDQRILLPAKESAAAEVTIHWITGKTERFRNLKLRETNLIEEGRGESP